MTGFLILGGLAVILFGVALRQGGPELALRGARTGVDLFLQVAPQLVMGFLLAGIVTVLLPRDALGRLVGAESGLLGIVIATAAGVATPGGPFLQFPLVASLATAGAGAGPIAAYLTAWSLISWQRVLVWELPFLGAPFTISRLAVSAVLPVLVGLAVPVLLRLGHER